MKKSFLLVSVFLMVHAGPLMADDFLGAPMFPEGKTVEKTKARLTITTNRSHDEVLDFYKEALKDAEDIKYREWKDATYIEDDSNRAWHSITISKGGQGETTVLITKDNWTWIIGTLVLRYVGVFVVLLFLLLGMALSGAIISRSVKKVEAK
jgi:hypothetical protein